MKIIDAFLSLIFPRTCAVCGEPAEKSSKYALCRACYDKFGLEKIRRCPDCGNLCRECRCYPSVPFKKGTEYIHVIEYGTEFSKRLIFTLKHKRKRAVTDFLSDELSRAAKDVENIGAVTFAPRSPESVKKYGFDQSGLLAAATAKKLGVKFLTLFYNNGGGEEQKTLGLAARTENASGSYEISKNAGSVAGTLVIIDDIITSGSTTKTLCELSYGAGIRKITVLTVAKTGHSKKFG